ncbi:MAG TPA: Crp/Fnr family transcriptional regulator [Steroidobacteraceae bacterium]|jgi:CRP-like cAMP-binding protein|nr:Crp/Fnr family transcriptional regulator [Steroidobacteraceae bacterium]
MTVVEGPARRGRPPPADFPNRILAALLATEYKRLLPELEHVTLTRGQVVYRADQDIEDVYFPEEAVVAMVDSMNDGRTVEVGLIGREGIVGINVVLGGVVTPDKAVVQLPGSAMRMKSRHLRKEMRFGSPLQRLLLAYARTFLAVISQSVACCQYHSIEQRLARWLLTMNDYAGAREFLMDHKSIARMLGVRREGISEAAGKLQTAGLVTYSRGRISVLDARAMEKKTCECYRFIRQQYRQLYGDLPRLLSGK